MNTSDLRIALGILADLDIISLSSRITAIEITATDHPIRFRRNADTEWELERDSA